MFIVIEAFGGAQYATVCTNDDGENMVFDTKDEAEAYSADCQNPIIVEVN